MLAKEILKAITQSKTLPKLPLDERTSSRVALHLQTFRYMLVLYGGKYSGISEKSCPKEFAEYLWAAKKVSNDVYNWSPDEVNFLKKVAFRPLYFDEIDEIFNKVEKSLMSTPYAVFWIKWY